VTIIDKALTNKLQLKPEYTRPTRIIDIRDNISTSQYITFSIEIGGKQVYLQIYILPRLAAEILIEMDIIRHCNIDVMISKNILFFDGVEVPLITKNVSIGERY